MPAVLNGFVVSSITPGEFCNSNIELRTDVNVLPINTYMETQNPAQRTDVFIFSSVQQCEKWRDFQCCVYVGHAQVFGWEDTCHS
jgi:hypothetical protein